LWAAGRGHEEVVKRLLAKDLVDPDSKDRYGQTPLLLATANGHGGTMKLLLAKDAVDPDSKDMFGRSPLSLASRRGNCNVVRLFHEGYEENGIAVCDEDVNIATPPAADHPICVTCFICVSSIPDIDIHYHCGICSDADFKIYLALRNP
jgi:ankyrin repeat protein